MNNIDEMKKMVDINVLQDYITLLESKIKLFDDFLKKFNAKIETIEEDEYPYRRDDTTIKIIKTITIPPFTFGYLFKKETSLRIQNIRNEYASIINKEYMKRG